MALLSNIAAPLKSAPSLRVEPLDSTIVPIEEVPPCAPPLRVEPPPGFNPLHVPPPAPTPKPPIVPTYDNSTGARGRKRRQQTRKRKEMATTVPPSTHSHGTRGNRKKQQHSAANTDTTTVHSDTYKNAGFNKKRNRLILILPPMPRSTWMPTTAPSTVPPLTPIQDTLPNIASSARAPTATNG
jgi:hypothetical protein